MAKHKRKWRWFPEKAPTTKRVCIGCVKPFQQKGTDVNLMEQFCGEKCKASFFKGYDLGLRVNGQVSRWPKMGGYARLVD